MKECRDAFLIVRRNANLFINLLNMMLSTGKRPGEGARVAQTSCEAHAMASRPSRPFSP